MEEIIILAAFVVASVIIEFLLIKKLPSLGRLAGRNRLVGVCMSVGLSWTLGEMFGAAGALVLIGSIISSVVTQPIHAFRVRRPEYLGRVRLIRTSARPAVHAQLSRLSSGRTCSLRLVRGRPVRPPRRCSRA